MWINQRDLETRTKLDQLKTKTTLKIGQPFAPIDTPYNHEKFQFLNYNYILDNPDTYLDILFFQGYGPETEKIIEVQKSGRVGLVATWFWDNHHLFIETTRNSILSDVNFCAHYYLSHYLHNEFSHWGGFIPLAPISWPENQIIELRDKYFNIERGDYIFGGYNSYAQWPGRTSWLKNTSVLANIALRHFKLDVTMRLKMLFFMIG